MTTDEARRHIDNDWLLRNENYCFECVPRGRGDNLRRVCKFCGESVPLWKHTDHLAAHQANLKAARKHMARRADRKRQEGLAKARAARRKAKEGAGSKPAPSTSST